MPEYYLLIRPFEKEDELDLVSLWKLCKLTVPWNNPQKDIARKLVFQKPDPNQPARRQAGRRGGVPWGAPRRGQVGRGAPWRRGGALGGARGGALEGGPGVGWAK